MLKHIKKLDRHDIEALATFLLLEAFVIATLTVSLWAK